MSTSELVGAVAFATAELGSGRFACSRQFRDLVSTANHHADSAAQHRGTWVAPVASLWTGNATPYVPIYGPGSAGALTVGGTTTETERWYMFPFRIPYTPHLRADGRGYRMRIWLAGASSDGGTVDFGVGLVPLHTRDYPGYDSAARFPRLEYTGVTATTAAVLTSDSGDITIDVTRAVVDAALGLSPDQATLTKFGGDPTTVAMPRLAVVPYAQTRSSGTVPHLYGLAAHEVIGTD